MFHGGANMPVWNIDIVGEGEGVLPCTSGMEMCSLLPHILSRIVANYEIDNQSITTRLTETTSDTSINVPTPEKIVNNQLNNKVRKRIHVVGDSMIKHLREKSISEQTQCDIKVKCYRGAKTADMKKHLKELVKKEKPENLILHIGTNDLNSNRTEEEIATSIISLATSYAQQTQVSMSEIITRDDFLNDKARNVNKTLQKMCIERNIAYVTHSNINKIHLNGSKLHLKKRGTKMLGKNLCQVIRKF